MQEHERQNERTFFYIEEWKYQQRTFLLTSVGDAHLERAIAQLCCKQSQSKQRVSTKPVATNASTWLNLKYNLRDPIFDLNVA